MELNDVQKDWDDTKSKVGYFIKNEMKRKLVGETYSYLIKIPQVVFWLTAIVTTFIMLTVELIIAGVLLGEHPVIYGELLLGFSVAAIVGLFVGKLYSKKVSTKIHAQISEILKFKPYKPEVEKES